MSLGYILYRFLYHWGHYFDYDFLLKTMFSVIVPFMDLGINIDNYWGLGVCFLVPNYMAFAATFPLLISKISRSKGINALSN